VENVLKIHTYLLDFGPLFILLFRLRIDVLLCGNMVGEMEKPLVIGKAAKPRCFKNRTINNLPLIWGALMTAAIMEEWLNMLVKNEEGK
jgi:hypothetical protein